jgi:hypothetical protein
MCSNAKLLLIALCGALISANLDEHAVRAETQAYRGAALNTAAGLVQQQQQQQQQAASAAQAGESQLAASQAAQNVLVQAAVFRDSKSQTLHWLKLSQMTKPGHCHPLGGGTFPSGYAR